MRKRENLSRHWVLSGVRDEFCVNSISFQGPSHPRLIILTSLHKTCLRRFSLSLSLGRSPCSPIPTIPSLSHPFTELATTPTLHFSLSLSPSTPLYHPPTELVCRHLPPPLLKKTTPSLSLSSHGACLLVSVPNYHVLESLSQCLSLSHTHTRLTHAHTHTHTHT